MSCVKYFSWDKEKNRHLKSERNISIEEVVFYLEKGQLLDIVEHPNTQHGGQPIFAVPQSPCRGLCTTAPVCGLEGPGGATASENVPL